jgi:GT2 family glycosyltransferase
VTHFIGVGHAIRKKVLEKTGLYPAEEFFYGMEEFYLSFKMLDAGYRIYYFPKVTVYHKLATGGRITKSIKARMKFENKMKIAIWMLPVGYIITWFLLRSIQTLISSKGNVLVVLRGWRNTIRNFPKLKFQRKVIAKSTIRKIRSLGGTLLY